MAPGGRSKTATTATRTCPKKGQQQRKAKATATTAKRPASPSPTQQQRGNQKASTATRSSPSLQQAKPTAKGTKRSAATPPQHGKKAKTATRSPPSQQQAKTTARGTKRPAATPPQHGKKAKTASRSSPSQLQVRATKKLVPGIKVAGRRRPPPKQQKKTKTPPCKKQEGKKKAAKTTRRTSPSQQQEEEGDKTTFSRLPGKEDIYAFPHIIVGDVEAWKQGGAVRTAQMAAQARREPEPETPDLKPIEVRFCRCPGCPKCQLVVKEGKGKKGKDRNRVKVKGACHKDKRNKSHKCKGCGERCEVLKGTAPCPSGSQHCTPHGAYHCNSCIKKNGLKLRGKTIEDVMTAFGKMPKGEPKAKLLCAKVRRLPNGGYTMEKVRVDQAVAGSVKVCNQQALQTAAQIATHNNPMVKEASDSCLALLANVIAMLPQLPQQGPFCLTVRHVGSDILGEPEFLEAPPAVAPPAAAAPAEVPPAAATPAAAAPAGMSPAVEIPAPAASVEVLPAAEIPLVAALAEGADAGGLSNFVDMDNAFFAEPLNSNNDNDTAMQGGGDMLAGALGLELRRHLDALLTFPHPPPWELTPALRETIQAVVARLLSIPGVQVPINDISY